MLSADQLLAQASQFSHPPSNPEADAFGKTVMDNYAQNAGQPAFSSPDGSNPNPSASYGISNAVSDAFGAKANNALNDYKNATSCLGCNGD
ncbi:MAG: hypothetical protein F8N37_12030 [Telmatospirillum sp.]|nr:hypothetical protein [Telmatospirillum sp.]